MRAMIIFSLIFQRLVFLTSKNLKTNKMQYHSR